MGGLERDSDKIQLILLWKGVFFGNFISGVCILLNFVHIAKDINVNAQHKQQLMKTIIEFGYETLFL